MTHRHRKIVIMKRTLLSILAVGMLFIPALATAHELWLEPERYTLDPGATLLADLRNGQNFSGVRLSFNPRDFVRFKVLADGAYSPVTGRLGDRPAARVPEVADGLVTLVYQSETASITYTQWEKFVAFVEHKDFPTALEQHRVRGLSETKFKEVYARYVKALVGVGGGAGADRVTGLETEIVALANPYTDALDTMPVRVLYRGAPRVDAQVELFDRGPDGTVAVTLQRTDAEGIARLPVAPGHTYLADAVVLREPAPELADSTGAVWETLWAALTFAVPAR